ncbi:hypothetical protein HDU84_000031 [Entophlyctis sp. JEL0112]|nr:hypothetical protein HDU84_000031 [Entophlyctis sp. JEL0112]
MEAKYRESSKWFRIPGNAREIREMDTKGIQAYFLKHADLPRENIAALSICNIVAGYLKKIMSRVPGGVVREETRKAVCKIFSKYNTTDIKAFSIQDRRAVQTLFSIIGNKRHELLRKIALVANKILAHDRVDAASLAVVIPVHDLQQSLMQTARAMALQAEGGDDVAAAHDMRALVDVCGEWNRILGQLFECPDDW